MFILVLFHNSKMLLVFNSFKTWRQMCNMLHNCHLHCHSILVNTQNILLEVEQLAAQSVGRVEDPTETASGSDDHDAQSQHHNDCMDCPQPRGATRESYGVKEYQRQKYGCGDCGHGAN